MSIAEDIAAGLLCQECTGAFLDGMAAGYPRTCAECSDDGEPPEAGADPEDNSGVSDHYKGAMQDAGRW